jgi:hypothetical protein
MKHTLALVLMVFGIVGCSNNYFYKPYSYWNMFGYTETQLGDNEFRVSYAPTQAMSNAQAVDLNLLRSAEITLNNASEWFEIIGSPSTEHVIKIYKDKPNNSAYNAQFLKESLERKLGMKLK